MSLIDTLLDLVRSEMAKPAPLWHTSNITEADKKQLVAECQQPSTFDPYHTRQAMVSNYINGTLTECTKECTYGRITVIFGEEGAEEDYPWELWGRILRTYGGKKPYRIYVLAHPRERRFPPRGQPIKPEHINGGYTYPCKKNMIMIYRAEDATRVLIHELQHAACLDDHTASVDDQEAETEAWAELIYCAFLSEGSPAKMRNLIRAQSTWMTSQNKEVAKHLRHPTDFPWRYTLAKQAVWERWGILHQNVEIFKATSLRLTLPPSAAQKRRWKVRTTSTVL